MSENTASESADGTAVNAGSAHESYTLFIADFGDTDTAWEAYDAVHKLGDGRRDDIEGVLVVIRDGHGKLEVHKASDHGLTGMTWGVIGGAVLGVLFPPAILGSAVVGGAVGAAAGKLHQPRHRKEIAEQAERAIAHTGVLAVAADSNAGPIREALARSSAIVESAVDAEVARQFQAAARKAADEDPD